MSRNEDRLVAPPQEPSTQQEVSQPSQPQPTSRLSFPTPTELVDLPSEGRFYPENHPLHNKKEIEIKYLTAKEEDILTNTSFLKKGVAIDRLLKSIILDTRIDPDTLLVGDKGAILIAARNNGYGNIYEANITCPFCAEGFNHQFDLDEIKPLPGSPEEAGASITNNKTIKITLPKTKFELECKFLTGLDDKRLSQIQEKKKKHKLPETFLTDQMKLTIISINGITDGDQISKCVETLPAVDTRWFRTVYKKSTPGMDTVFSVECPACGQTQEVDMPLRAEFFWPK
jgi:hypothetical protein